MTDEIVDIVDENDKVIGKELKSICHKKGLRHRIAGVILLSSKGKMWLQTRNKNKTGGNLLDFSASGHIKSGTTYEEGAYRELEEELGIRTPLTSIGESILYEKVDIEGKKIRHSLRFFYGKNNGPFVIQKEELESIEEYDKEYIKNLVEKDSKIMTTAVKMALRLFFKEINQSSN